MQVLLPDHETCSAYTIRCERPMGADEFYEFCKENSDLRIEREANGDIIILPLGGAETAFRNAELSAQVWGWSKRDGHGLSVSNAGFILPNGAVRGPYTAWVLKSRLANLTKANLTKEQKRRFLALCPDFIVELTSPSDRLSKVMSKMREWTDNGAALGWLIDADRRTVYVYRPGKEPEELVDPEHIDGEGPVEGFRLDLSEIWQGL